MEIPEKCHGCNDLNRLLASPVKNLLTSIEELTREQVATFGGSTSPYSDGIPEFVTLQSGQKVDTDTLQQAMDISRKSYDKKYADIKNQIDHCPGQQEVIQEDGSVINICGKMAVSNYLDSTGKTHN